MDRTSKRIAEWPKRRDDEWTDQRTKSKTRLDVYMATPVACGWAGAVFEVTRAFGQEQGGQIKMWPTDRRTKQGVDSRSTRLRISEPMIWPTEQNLGLFEKKFFSSFFFAEFLPYNHPITMRSWCSSAEAIHNAINFFLHLLPKVMIEFPFLLLLLFLCSFSLFLNSVILNTFLFVFDCCCAEMNEQTMKQMSKIRIKTIFNDECIFLFLGFEI